MSIRVFKLWSSIWFLLLTSLLFFPKRSDDETRGEYPVSDAAHFGGFIGGAIVAITFHSLKYNLLPRLKRCLDNEQASGGADKALTRSDLTLSSSSDYHESQENSRLPV